MSNMGDGSFGLVDFGDLSGEESDQNWFYVVRTFLSIVINISSILLVLIDAVCLEVGRVEKTWSTLHRLGAPSNSVRARAKKV